MGTNIIKAHIRAPKLKIINFESKKCIIKIKIFHENLTKNTNKQSYMPPSNKNTPKDDTHRL